MKYLLISSIVFLSGCVGTYLTPEMYEDAQLRCAHSRGVKSISKPRIELGKRASYELSCNDGSSMSVIITLKNNE